MKVFIENEAGSFVKHIYNEKTLELQSTVRVSRAYPFPYGFVPHTSAEDGDNVDCFVLTKRLLRTGEIIECEPVGLMEQVEDGEIDHKIIAQISGEESFLDEHVTRVLVEFARRVFAHITGKRMEIGAFRDKATALAHIRQRQDIPD